MIINSTDSGLMVYEFQKEEFKISNVKFDTFMYA